MKKKVCTLILAGAVAVGLTGCGLLPKEEELPTAPVLVEAETEEYTVANVARGDVRVTESIRANYVPSASEKLGFQVGDELISKIYVQVGDEVKAGDVLAELNISDQQDQLRQQQDRVDDLYLQLEHLYESEQLSLSAAQLQDEQAAENSVAGWESQMDAVLEQYEDQAKQIKNSIQVAEKRLEELQEQIEERQIIASIDGTVTYLYEFQEGERSVEGQSVITLSDMSKALFEVYSENADMLEIGKTYILTCSDVEYEVVARTAAELEGVEVKEGYIYLSMVTPDPALTQGASGSVELVLEESLSTLWVPDSAVREMRGEYVVYCIDDQGFREMREVKVGVQNGKITEILSGLEENEVVIID